MVLAYGAAAHRNLGVPGEEVEGVHARMGGVVPLTSAEASYLRMVVEEPKVVVAFSPTGLTHLLDKLAVPYTLLQVWLCVKILTVGRITFSSARLYLSKHSPIFVRSSAHA